MSSKKYNIWKNLITFSIIPIVFLSSYIETTNNPGESPLSWGLSGVIGAFVYVIIIALIGSTIELARKNKKDVTGLSFFIIPWVVLVIIAVNDILNNI